MTTNTTKHVTTMTNSNPTEREQSNWETFYEVMEKYTRESEGEYYGGDGSVCLIGLTASRLVRQGNECIINAKEDYGAYLYDGTIPSSILFKPSDYDSNVWALAQCYHIHPDVMNRIYITASKGTFNNDLGDALVMAREYLAEAERLGYTWEKYIEEEGVPCPDFTPKVVREMLGSEEDDDDE